MTKKQPRMVFVCRVNRKTGEYQASADPVRVSSIDNLSDAANLAVLSFKVFGDVGAGWTIHAYDVSTHDCVAAAPALRRGIPLCRAGLNAACGGSSGFTGARFFTRKVFT